MAPHSALAFSTALLIALALTPLVRRLALTLDLVDRPGQRKWQLAPVPYLGGIALIAAVLATLLFAPELGAPAGALALAGGVLGAMGLLDDDRSVHPATRFGAEVAVAIIAVLVGLRVHFTNVDAIDVFVTMLWVVGITNAFNLLDNMDGLSAGVAGTAAVAVFVLAVLADQRLTASLSAAVGGACLGFLAYNRSPASIYMGDAGSLFLGFVLAILTVEVTPAMGPPSSFAIPLMLLALPVLDTTTVTLGRLRHGRSIFVGGTDHLSHRLVARGLTKERAVAVLVLAQALLGALAVLGGRRLIPLLAALAAGFLVVTALAVVTSRAEVYAERADAR